MNAHRSLNPLPIDKVIFTDASKKGWGAIMNDIKTGGEWLHNEKGSHINVLEIKAVYFALKSLIKTNLKHVRIMIDNTTAVTYVNKMGGTQSHACNEIAQNIWQWAITRNIWLSAAHIPGTQNPEADFQSRNFDINKSSEWTLTDFIFQKIVHEFIDFGKPDIDLFASRTNFKINKYVSWKPDPDCFAVDAFSINWNKSFPFCFPPFSLIQKVLKTIIIQQVDVAIVVAPMWPTQTWFPMLTNLLVSPPLIFKSGNNNLFHPGHPSTPHPLAPKLKLMAVLLSTNDIHHQNFHHKLRTSSYMHGETVQEENMKAFSRNGNCIVVKGMKIPLKYI